MATRALIGYLNPNNTITTTYNHYDGYPDNLGKALDRHYDDDDKAKEIANMGYISFVEPVNGDIEANNKKAPVTVGDEDLISSLQYFKDEASNVDYAYLYIPGLYEWIMSPTSVRMEVFVDTFIDAMESTVEEFDEDEYESDIMNGTIDESYVDKWKKFLNEENMDNKVVGDTSTAVRDAEEALEGEPNLDVYIDSLTNDIRLNGDDAYLDYGDDDWKEDFDNYIADRMDQ